VSKEELVHLDGEVILIAKGGNFGQLDNGHEVLAKLAARFVGTGSAWCSATGSPSRSAVRPDARLHVYRQR